MHRHNFQQKENKKLNEGENNYTFGRNLRFSLIPGFAKFGKNEHSS